MARSKGITISVKVPVAWTKMTKRKCQRLRQIVGRDTRIIKAYLGIIENHEPYLIHGKYKNRINESLLHQLTMTAIKVKTGTSQRLTVDHDMKKRFPRASQNELTECRQTAVSIYESYLSLRKKKNRKSSRPSVRFESNRIPRWMFSAKMFDLVRNPTTIARWWIDIRDSLDSTSRGRKIHDRLVIPLKFSPFHENQIKRGELKAAQIFQDRHRKWWVNFAVRLPLVEKTDSARPMQMAVLGIDLGIKKAVCTTLLTEKKVSETRYFLQKEKIKVIAKYDKLVASLQRERDTRNASGYRLDEIIHKLKTIRCKRKNVSKEYDRVLVRQLLDYIQQLSEKYDLYVALGKMKGIRAKARRGNYTGRKYRGMVHSWAFSRISQSLKNGLSQLGWVVEGKNAHYNTIPEQWTSIKCWKCGRKGFRPKQSLFVCSCGFKTNGDRNGSLNIARRLIRLIPLLHRDEKGLGRWAIPEKAPAPKTGKKISSSKRIPSLSSKDDALHLGEPAAVHSTQLSLLDCIGDEAKECDNDPAVVKTVEIYTDTGKNASRIHQKEEIESVGGIVSR